MKVAIRHLTICLQIFIYCICSLNFTKIVCFNSKANPEIYLKCQFLGKVFLPHLRSHSSNVASFIWVGQNWIRHQAFSRVHFSPEYMYQSFCPKWKRIYNLALFHLISGLQWNLWVHKGEENRRISWSFFSRRKAFPALHRKIPFLQKIDHQRNQTFGKSSFPFHKALGAIQMILTGSTKNQINIFCF